MTAIGGAAHWVTDRGYENARCPRCSQYLEGAEQPNGIWCDSSLPVSKITPLGQYVIRATCLISAQQRECDRWHYYKCPDCGWDVLMKQAKEVLHDERNARTMGMG